MWTYREGLNPLVVISLAEPRQWLFCGSFCIGTCLSAMKISFKMWLVFIYFCMMFGCWKSHSVIWIYFLPLCCAWFFLFSRLVDNLWLKCFNSFVLEVDKNLYAKIKNTVSVDNKELFVLCMCLPLQTNSIYSWNIMTCKKCYLTSAQCIIKLILFNCPCHLVL